MDQEKLKLLVKKSALARAMFEHFKTRDRNPKDGIMSLHHTKRALRQEGVEVVPKELIANFKELQKAGLGRLEPDSSKPERFVWKVLMKDAVHVIFDDGLHEHTPVIKTAESSHAHSFKDMAFSIMNAELNEKEIKMLIAMLEVKLK